MCVAMAGAVRVAGAAAMLTFLVNGLFLDPCDRKHDDLT